jgi:hypothetical protein
LLARLQPVATWNLHTTQPNTLFPTYDEVVNLTGLLETKVKEHFPNKCILVFVNNIW